MCKKGKRNLQAHGPGLLDHIDKVWAKESRVTTASAFAAMIFVM